MQPITRRTALSASALTLAAAPALSACGSSGPGGKSDGPLQFLLSGDDNQGGGYSKMIEKYTKETGVEIQIVDVPYDDLTTKVRNGAKANDLPALGRMPSVDPSWVERTVDLAEIVKTAKPIEGMTAADDDGKYPSLPSDLTAVGMFLNKDLWDKAGVDFPTSFDDDIWTWDEFVDAATEVQDKADAKYSLVMDRTSHRLTSFLYQMGSEGMPLSDDLSEYSADAKTAPALEYFAKLNDDTFSPKSVWLSEEDPSAMFKTGQVAAYYSGSWQIADFSSNIKDFKWVSVPMPAQPVQATNFGPAAYMVVFDGTGREDEALDFLTWLYKPENYAELSKISGFLPAVEDVKIEYEDRQKDFDLYNEAIENSPDFVGKRSENDLKLQVKGTAAPLSGDPLRDETVKVISGSETAEDAVDTALDLLNESLEG